MNIKYLISIFCISVLLFLPVSGNGNNLVKTDEALNISYDWLSSLKNVQLELQFIKPIIHQDQVTIYIVQYKNGGWCFVSANKITKPIIAFATSGFIDTNLTNSGFNNLVKKYKDEIISSTNQDITNNYWNNPSSSLYKNSTIDSVGPLMQNYAWDQGSPYNKYTPVYVDDGVEKNVWVGCVATAMVQIMRYYEHPFHGRGSNSYLYFPFWDLLNSRILSMDFEKSSYYWNIMPTDDDFTIVGEDGEYAVAKVSYDCGISINMNYQQDGSGALTQNVRTALVNNFRYSSKAKFIDRADYTTEEWNQFLVNDIDNDRPIVYSGFDLPSYAGHAFVCDGYMQTEMGLYFHINWGWGGRYNGWFELSDLRPTSTHSKSFSYIQQAVIGVEPRAPNFVGELGLIDSNGIDISSAKVNPDDLLRCDLFLNYKNEDLAAYNYKVELEFSGARSFTFPTYEPQKGNYRVSFYAPSKAGEYYIKAFVYTTNLTENERVYESNSLSFEVNDLTTSISEENELPKEYSLSQNYPNPFNPTTIINYSIPKQENVTIKVFDLLGKEIKTLVDEINTAGNYTVEFNGSDLKSGVYFYQIKTGKFIETRIMSLVK